MAVEDYLYSFRRLFSFGQYFVINVSSPNTPGLRQLQEKKNLDGLLSAVERENALLTTEFKILRKRILVKIAPDLTLEAIDELLEVILLVADLQELKSQTDVPAEGLIIESYMDGSKGPVATAIIKKGVLKAKDIIATDLAMAKVKSVKDFMGNEIKKATPSQPVIILGFEKVPAVGEKFKSYKTENKALEEIKKEKPKREIGPTVLDLSGDKKVLNIILKGDVFGSLEAIEGMLKNLPQDKIV